MAASDPPNPWISIELVIRAIRDRQVGRLKKAILSDIRDGAWAHIRQEWVRRVKKALGMTPQPPRLAWCMRLPTMRWLTVTEQVQAPRMGCALSVDVCLASGGYAKFVDPLHPGPPPVRPACWSSHCGLGASGRNGGQVHVGLRGDQQWLEGRLGREAAHQLWDFALAARAHLDWVLQTYGVQCDLRPGLLHADHRARFADDTRRHVEFMQREDDYQDLRFVERDEVAGMVASPGYYCGSFDRRAGHLHALNWALGIARAAASHGAELYEQVEVSI